MRLGAKITIGLMHRSASALDPMRTRFAAPRLVGDDQRLFIQHRPLDARPRASVDAELLAHQAAQDIGGRSQDADGEPRLVRRVEVPQLPGEGRRIGEVENPRSARGNGNRQPDGVLGGFSGDLGRAPRCLFQAKLRVAVALDEPFDVLEQVGPHRLRTGIAAPCAPDRRSDQEKTDPRHDQEPGHVIEFVRPDLDREHVESPRGKVDQHRLVGSIRAAVPAQPRGHVINCQGNGHHQPLEAAERTVDRLGKDLAALFEKLLPWSGQVFRAGHCW